MIPDKFGIRLPPERYCLTSNNYGLKKVKKQVSVSIKISLPWNLQIMDTLGPTNLGVILLLYRGYILSEVKLCCHWSCRDNKTCPLQRGQMYCVLYSESHLSKRGPTVVTVWYTQATTGTSVTSTTFRQSTNPLSTLKSTTVQMGSLANIPASLLQNVLKAQIVPSNKTLQNKPTASIVTTRPTGIQIKTDTSVATTAGSPMLSMPDIAGIAGKKRKLDSDNTI